MVFEYAEVQSCQYSTKKTIQTTLDQDFNVSEQGHAMEQMITYKGDVILHHMKILKDRLIVKGVLRWHVLYMRGDQDSVLDSMDGELPFEEVVNIDGLTEQADVCADWDIEDLRIHIIHSRKLSVRAIIQLHFSVRHSHIQSAVTQINDDKDIFFSKWQEKEISQQVVNRRDTIHIKGELTLPSQKDTIRSVIWQDMELEHVDLKLHDQMLRLSGDSQFFILYTGENNEKVIDYYVSDLSWHAEIASSLLKEQMLVYYRLHKISQSVKINLDKDGERRMMSIEAEYLVDWTAYATEKVLLLEDAYCLSKSLQLKKDNIEVEEIIMRNQTECQVTDRIELSANVADVLQVCYSWADVRVDQTKQLNRGIHVEGVADIKLLYINSCDERPIDMVQTQLPFETLIETSGGQYEYEIRSSIDQLNISMGGSHIAEIRMTIKMDALIKRKTNLLVIASIEEKEYDWSELSEIADIIGYTVKEGESLFDLGKQFHTTEEELMTINQLKTNEIHPGERLLIVKHAAQ